MQQIVYRQNHKFYINEKIIKPEHRTAQVINGLYAAIYDEFKGAIHNDKYANLNAYEKMQQLNQFAYDWLSKRGFI